MSLMRIHTNIRINNKKSLMDKSSKMFSELVSRPENFVMIIIEDEKDIYFNRSDEPAAFIEFKNSDLKDTLKLSETISQFMESELDIPRDRIFIEFYTIPSAMWGYDGTVI